MWRFTAVRALVTVLACGGCTNEPTDVTLLPENIVTNKGEGRTVTGTVPTAPDGSLSLVLLEPHKPGDFAAPTEPAVLDQFGMAFLPAVLLAKVGQPVHFTNSEDELHNVRVFDIKTKETIFNISTPLDGVYAHIFDQAGTYTVACDVHSAMGASIIVTSIPYAAVADRDGRFTLHDVAPGAYTLTVHTGSVRQERVVEIASSTTELILNEKDENTKLLAPTIPPSGRS